MSELEDLKEYCKRLEEANEQISYLVNRSTMYAPKWDIDKNSSRIMHTLKVANIILARVYIFYTDNIYRCNSSAHDTNFDYKFPCPISVELMQQLIEEYVYLKKLPEDYMKLIPKGYS